MYKSKLTTAYQATTGFMHMSPQSPGDRLIEIRNRGQFIYFKKFENILYLLYLYRNRTIASCNCTEKWKRLTSQSVFQSAYQQGHSWRHGGQREDSWLLAAAPRETHRMWSVFPGREASVIARLRGQCGEIVRCPSTAGWGVGRPCRPRTGGIHACATRCSLLPPSDWWRHDPLSPSAANHLQQWRITVTKKVRVRPNSLLPQLIKARRYKLHFIHFISAKEDKFCLSSLAVFFSEQTVMNKFSWNFFEEALQQQIID